MDLKKQIEIMETQLACFDNLMNKMQYIYEFFDPDPEFTKEAKEIVIANIIKERTNYDT